MSTVVDQHPSLEQVSKTDAGDELAIGDVNIEESQQVEVKDVEVESNTQETKSTSGIPASNSSLEQLPCWSNIPLKYDGWNMIHDAIRLDMNDFVATLAALKGHVEADKGAAWMGVYLEKWYVDRFYHQIHHHHSNEEDTFFPFLETKQSLPPRMSADHVTLLADLDATKTMVIDLAKALSGDLTDAQVKATVLEQLATLYSKFVAMQESMCEHLKEEEEEGLPIQRANFTVDEVKVVEKKILAGLDKNDLAQFLRPLSNDDKKMWLKKYAKVPGPVISFVLFKWIKDNGKYYQEYTRLMDSIVKGEEIARASNGSCFIM